MPILRWLGFVPVDDGVADGHALAEVERAFASLGADRARFLAAFAYLLGRVARADHDVSDDEAASMTRLVADVGGLPADQAALAVRLATLQGLRFGGTDDFLVAREFGRIAQRPDKLALLESLFAVSAADDAIGTAEDNEIRRIASEMGLSHEDFIAARLEYARHLTARRGK
ncbi:MAG: TerB family tellurite resistance protein [Acidobacteriota bacterium]